MNEVTKTLELKLVSPNAHKRRKLRETTDAYRAALHAAFGAGCTTQSAANDVVVEYDLSGYAKNALKKYVPQLCGGSFDLLHALKGVESHHGIRASSRRSLAVPTRTPRGTGSIPGDLSFESPRRAVARLMRPHRQPCHRRVNDLLVPRPLSFGADSHRCRRPLYWPGEAIALAETGDTCPLNPA